MIHKVIYYFHVLVYSEVLTHFSPLWQEWIGMCKCAKKQLKELQHREVKQTNQNKASQVLLHITISPKGQFLALLKSRPLRVHLCISRQQNLLKILNSHMKTQCLEWLIIVLPWPAFVTVTDSGRNLELIQILSPLITSSLWLKKKVWSCEENLNFLLKLIFLFSFF